MENSENQVENPSALLKPEKLVNLIFLQSIFNVINTFSLHQLFDILGYLVKSSGNICIRIREKSKWIS